MFYKDCELQWNIEDGQKMIVKESFQLKYQENARVDIQTTSWRILEIIRSIKKC